MGAEDGAVDKDSRSGSVFGDYARLRAWEANQRMRDDVYRKIMQSGESSRIRGKHLKEAKDKILSYTPGAWIGTAGAMKRREYDVPKTTTLLLVGPKGSGKSSLINRISKVLEDDKFASERAQVSYNSSVGDGTLFLHEYMMPRGSTSFCIYDSRSLSDDSAENIKFLKDWIENGVRHGELAIRDSDNQNLRTAMMCKAHDNVDLSSAIRKVNFVIFVVNGLPVLEALESEEDAKTQYTQMIASMFNCPFLAFKESSDPVTESTTIDMLRYSLEHAEKNYTHKKKVPTVLLLPCMLLLMLLGTAINIWCMYHHAHIQQGPSALSAIQHCQFPQAHIQHCSFPHAHIQHDHGPLPEEHDQKEPLPEEHIEKEPLPEEDIQQDPLPQEHILQDAQEQVQQDTLPLEQVQQDPLPQEDVLQDPLPQGHVQQDPLPQDHVDAVSVLKSIESNEDAVTRYSKMIATAFNSQHLAFKDDKPLVVVTQGDLLSQVQRSRVRVHLGELLGIPPVTQIFDIPESNDPVTDLTIVDMLCYALEHADKNFPHKRKVQAASVLLCMLLPVAVLGLLIQDGR